MIFVELETGGPLNDGTDGIASYLWWNYSDVKRNGQDARKIPEHLMNNLLLKLYQLRNEPQNECIAEKNTFETGGTI